MTGMPIPEDIDRIATDLVRADYSGDHDPEWAMYKAIAGALAAERERCAKLAEHRALVALGRTPQAVFALLDALAPAIRNQA